MNESAKGKSIFETKGESPEVAPRWRRGGLFTSCGNSARSRSCTVEFCVGTRGGDPLSTRALKEKKAGHYSVREAVSHYRCATRKNVRPHGRPLRRNARFRLHGRPTFDGDVLNGEAQNDRPNHPERQFRIPVDNF